MIDLSLRALRATGAVPHYFGLGFIQLKLDEGRRLHFWVPSWPTIPGSDTEIHDHRYDFTSHVIKGAVEQEVFMLGPLRGTPQIHDWELIEVDCKPGAAGTEPGIKGYVSPIKLVAHRVEAGGFYRLGHQAFHRARSSGPTVTLLERGPTVKPLAQVVRPVGTPFACPFAMSPSTEACWAEIERVVG